MNGFRCRSAEELAEAIGRAGEIEPRRCKDRALGRFGPVAVGPALRRFVGALTKMQ